MWISVVLRENIIRHTRANFVETRKIIRDLSCAATVAYHCSCNKHHDNQLNVTITAGRIMSAAVQRKVHYSLAISRREPTKISCPSPVTHSSAALDRISMGFHLEFIIQELGERLSDPRQAKWHERWAKEIIKWLQVCAKGKMDRLRAVKSTYDERIKICNEKTAEGLRAAKTICDHRVQEMDALRSAMRQILKECLETNDFVKCMASETREAVKRRKQISNELNETVKSAETSIANQLKEASKCHVYAQMEALQELQQILKDTQDCIK